MEDELTPFYTYTDLYLKPIHNVSITVTLPKLRQIGQSISNWEIRERLKKMLHPIELSDFKVLESTLEYVKFAATVGTANDVKFITKTLDGTTFRAIGFTEPLSVAASRAQPDHPTRVDWDRFFADNPQMDEREPGERPDTIYLSGLPFEWFQSAIEEDYEKTFKRIFSEFGEVIYVDIPQCDQYRKLMDPDISGIHLSSWSFGEDLFFEVYVQFKDYTSFVSAMSAMCGKVLVQKNAGVLRETRYRVDFDKSAHLSIRKITQRQLKRACIEYEKDQNAMKELTKSKKLEEMIEEEKRRRQDEERERMARRLIRAEKRKQIEAQKSFEHKLRKRLKTKLTRRIKSTKKEREAGAKALLSYIARLYREQQKALQRSDMSIYDMASDYARRKGLPPEELLRERIKRKAQLKMRSKVNERIISSHSSQSYRGRKYN